MKKNNFLFSCILIVLVVTFAINIKAQEEDNDNGLAMTAVIDAPASCGLSATVIQETRNAFQVTYQEINEDTEIPADEESLDEDSLAGMFRDYGTVLDRISSLTKEDYEYIFQLKNINFLLREDIKLFREFLSSSDDDSYKAFFLNHTNVFKKLEELLQIEDFEGNGEEEQNEE